MFENDILAFVLAGDDPTLAVLRAQAKCASTTERHLTGAGFFLHYDVPSHAPRLSGVQSLRIGDAGCTVNEQDCGLIVFVNGGALDFLECHVWSDADLSEPFRVRDP